MYVCSPVKCRHGKAHSIRILRHWPLRSAIRGNGNLEYLPCLYFKDKQSTSNTAVHECAWLKVECLKLVQIVDEFCLLAHIPSTISPNCLRLGTLTLIDSRYGAFRLNR